LADEVKYAVGFYGGEIQEIAFDVDDDDDDKPVVGFKVKMDDFDEPCWCWHKCYGKRQDGGLHLDKTRGIVETMGGTWADLDTFDPTGKRTTVGVFHNTTQSGKVYENCYVVTGGNKRGSAKPEKVTSALSKLTGKTLGSGLPF